MKSNGGIDIGFYHGDSASYRMEIAKNSDGTELNATIRTRDGIYLRGAGNSSLHIYGSYNNNTGYHTGYSGQIEYDPGLGTGTRYLCFVNGILITTIKA